MLTFNLLCSDILTPLPALGVPFEIDDIKGPLIANPVRTLDQVISLKQDNWCNCTCCVHALAQERLSSTSQCVLQVRQLRDVDLTQLQFVGDALTNLRQEVQGQASADVAVKACSC